MVEGNNKIQDNGDPSATKGVVLNQSAAIEDALHPRPVYGLEGGENTGNEQQAAEEVAEQARRNYRTHTQRALRSIRSARDGCAQAGMDTLAGVSLKEIGRVALPLSVEQKGDTHASFCLHPYLCNMAQEFVCMHCLTFVCWVFQSLVCWVFHSCIPQAVRAKARGLFVRMYDI